MGKFIAVALLITIALGATLAAVEALLASPAFMFALIAATIPVVLIVGLGVVAAGVFVARYAAESLIAVRRQRVFVSPDARGLLPVAEQLLLNPAFAMAALEVHRAKAQQVPSSLHYSVRGGKGDDVIEVKATAPSAIQPESFWQLLQAHKLPNKGFLMGYSLEDGSEVLADWGKLYSALIGGQSGSGKSTMIRSILAQSALQGGRFIVIDKHYGAGDQSLGESLQPLRHLMLCDVAASEDSIISTLAYVRNIGARRLAGQDKDKSPVILVVDETTAMLQRSTTAQALTDVLGEISQETRKVGVFALCIGQNFHGKIMDTTVRDSFVSFISCRARRNVAKTMTDNNEFGKMAQDLATGQAVWMTPGGEVHRLAVPNCTEHDLDLVASHLGRKTDTVPGNYAITPVRASTATSTRVSTAPSTAADLMAAAGADTLKTRVLDLYLAGESQNAILKELWGDPVGRAKVKASQEFNEIIREQLRGEN